MGTPVVPPPEGPAVGRALALVAGLILFGCGIGVLFLADLGVGPWDVFHDGLGRRLDRAPGTVIMGLGAGLLGVLVILRQPIGPATVANVAIIGTTVNVLLEAVDPPGPMAARVALVLVAPMTVGLGSMLYLGAGLGVGPRDGLMTALIDQGRSPRLARTTGEVVVL